MAFSLGLAIREGLRLSEQDAAARVKEAVQAQTAREWFDEAGARKMQREMKKQATKNLKVLSGKAAAIKKDPLVGVEALNKIEGRTDKGNHWVANTTATGTLVELVDANGNVMGPSMTWASGDDALLTLRDHTLTPESLISEAQQRKAATISSQRAAALENLKGSFKLKAKKIEGEYQVLTQKLKESTSDAEAAKLLTEIVYMKHGFSKTPQGYVKQDLESGETITATGPENTAISKEVANALVGWNNAKSTGAGPVAIFVDALNQGAAERLQADAAVEAGKLTRREAEVRDAMLESPRFTTEDFTRAAQAAESGVPTDVARDPRRMAAAQQLQERFRQRTGARLATEAMGGVPEFQPAGAGVPVPLTAPDSYIGGGMGPAISTDPVIQALPALSGPGVGSVEPRFIPSIAKQGAGIDAFALPQTLRR